MRAGDCVWVIPTRYWEDDPLVQVELVLDWLAGDKHLYVQHPDEESPYYIPIYQKVFVDREDAVSCREGLKLLREAEIGNDTALLISRMKIAGQIKHV